MAEVPISEDMHRGTALNSLKYAAIAAMTVDHIAYAFVPNGTVLVIKKSEKRAGYQGEYSHVKQNDHAVCKCLIPEIAVKPVKYQDHDDPCAAPVCRNAEYDKHQNQTGPDCRISDSTK